MLTKTSSSLGFKHKLETKVRLSEVRTGKLHSPPSPSLGVWGGEETKEKLREMFSGKKNPFWGKTHTSEVIDKLKQRSGEANPMFNKTKSLHHASQPPLWGRAPLSWS